eukprot:15458357-Alexandrium_andersonii.AAC.1
MPGMAGARTHVACAPRLSVPQGPRSHTHRGPRERRGHRSETRPPLHPALPAPRAPLGQPNNLQAAATHSRLHGRASTG